jgi:hypothetical protein
LKGSKFGLLSKSERIHSDKKRIQFFENKFGKAEIIVFSEACRRRER